MADDDTILYVDNEVALFVLIKTSSVTACHSPMTHVSGLIAVLLQAHILSEWVLSHQDASGGLSRDGVFDRAVKHRLASGEWDAVESVIDWYSTARGIFGGSVEHPSTSG